MFNDSAHKKALTCLLGVSMLLLLCVSPATAIWHTLLNEHFSSSAAAWPWGSWSISPYPPGGPPYSWGVQDYIYHTGWSDDHSLWCVGEPNTLDPEFDPYPNNTNAWARWGPFNLQTAEAAKATFWYYCWCEPVADYVRWGGYGQNSFNMYEADRFSGITTQWNFGEVNFDSLNHGAISLLGDNSVWLVFQFYSNWSQQNMGAFIDAVSIAWDDGTFDLRAELIWLANPDSTMLATAAEGDTIRFAFSWVAAGSGTTPPFNITCTLDSNLLSSERRTAAIGNNQQVWLTSFSDLWVVEPDTHTVVWMLDASYEIAEAYENNNDTLLTFVSVAPNVPPWIEVLRPSWGDSANSQFWIKWDDEDPDDNATITLFWDTDSVGNNGMLIPTGLIWEDSPVDSVSWNVSSLPEGPVWVAAYISDGDAFMWDYSEGPLIVYHPSGIVEPGWKSDLPESFAIQSVYPNPFNAEATIRLGMPRSAEVALKIYDTAGRLGAVLYQGRLTAGVHELRWAPDGLPAGIYIVELRTPSASHRTKVIYLK
ncbi:MAG: T9SS type A sorting domain-containing protein [bacterium]